MPKTNIKKPRIAGTGLIALDVVSERKDSRPRLFAGGTCGNVHAILSNMGWFASPIGRLDGGFAGEFVRSDLERWGVDTSLLSLTPTARTPVVFQKIRADRNGVPFHTFSFYCPDCGHRVPGFQPVTAKTVESIVNIVKSADVFFVDRVSKSAILLAEVVAANDGLVVFEPSSSDGSKSFQRMVALAHIVKYSNERLDDLGLPTRGDRPPIEVQTLGRGGLRFRINNKGWWHMDAEPLTQLKDAAGAGDWLTAGLIHALRSRNGKAARSIGRNELTNALAFGQSLAAWNCQFVGARGGMYSELVSEIELLSKRWLDTKIVPIRIGNLGLENQGATSFCSSCSSLKDSVPRTPTGTSH